MNRNVVRRGMFVLMLLIACVVCSTAIRIEVLNARVGGFLPRPQPPSVEGNDVKWRIASIRALERSFRQQLLLDRGVEYSDEALESLVLTPDEVRVLEAEKQLARLNARFRSVVSSIGLLQYPLIPVGLVLCIVVFVGKGKLYRVGALLCAGIFLASGYLMLYREYLPSLGW